MTDWMKVAAITLIVIAVILLWQTLQLSAINYSTFGTDRFLNSIYNNISAAEAKILDAFGTKK